MTITISWRPEAFGDLERLIDHIRIENPIAARKVGRELILATDSLTTFP